MKTLQIVMIFILFVLSQVIGFFLGYTYYKSNIDKQEVIFKEVVPTPDNSELESCRSELRRDSVSINALQELADKKGFGSEVKVYLQQQEEINY